MPPLHSLLTCDLLAMMHMEYYTSVEQSACCSDALGFERNAFNNTKNGQLHASHGFICVEEHVDGTRVGGNVAIMRFVIDASCNESAI